MHVRRVLELVVLGLSAASVAEATFVNPRLVRHGKALQRRQDNDGNSNAASSGTSTSGPSPSTTPTSTPPPETTPSTTSSSTTSPKPDDKTTSTPSPDSSSSSATQSPPRTTQSTPSSTGDTPGTTPSPGQSTSSQEGQETTITKFITATSSNGVVYTTLEVSTSTLPPGFQSGSNSNSGGSGMSPQTRTTVIGVVVGIGGAIILAGLGFVAWRIWGRKKDQEEADNLMVDYNSLSHSSEKPDTVGGSTSGRSPFQSTLESYHAPTQVNTASNF